MHLYRNNLIKGIFEQEFLLLSKTLDLTKDEIKPELNCILTCKSESEGFKLNGVLNYILKLQCDRCLLLFEKEKNNKFEILLTSKENVNDNYEIIFFPKDMDKIDISFYLRDLIYLDKSMKILCYETCKGLCSICGKNLNKESCCCIKDDRSSPFKKLNHLMSN